MRYVLWLLWAIISMGPTTAIGQSGKIERDVENKGGLYVQAKGPEHVPPNGSKLRIKRKAHPLLVRPHEWSVVQTEGTARRRPRSASDVVDGQQPPRPLRTPVKRENPYTVHTASTPSQTSSMAIDEDGTDYFYFSDVKFGSSGKSMYLLVDTGSANTWVIGSGCTTKACSLHNTFGPSDSTTLKATQSKFDLTYGSGTVSGTVFNDTVQMAGLSLPLSFGLASTTSDEFSTYPMDGILGLGRPTSGYMDSPTVMETVAATSALPQNLFGISLQRNSDGTTDGEINFGAPDPSKYSGDLLYTSINSNGSLWEIPIGDIVINGVSAHFNGKIGIVDSGTSFLLLPPNDAKAVHDRIPNSVQANDGFNVPCSSSSSLQIKISNIMYSIATEDYIGSPVNGGPMCSSNIVARQTFGPDQWLLGDVFMKNVYTVFDFDKNRIGFGIKPSKKLPTPSSSSEAVTSSKPSPIKSSTATTSSDIIIPLKSSFSITTLAPTSPISSSSMTSTKVSPAPTNDGTSTSSISIRPSAISGANLHSLVSQPMLGYLLFFVNIVFFCP